MAKLPIRMEFPQFGESRDSADVTDFIEQCENFLTLRPLSDIELLGTLNAVLQGPAQSWWLAARSKVSNWGKFKGALLKAFLPTDYQSEIEEQLHAHVQAPTQCLRVFSYNRRALCLKWRPEMPEEEVVRRILGACKPRLASGLRGIVATVDQEVKVGSRSGRHMSCQSEREPTECHRRSRLLLKNNFKRILAGGDGCGEQAEDRHDHPSRPIPIQAHAIWFA